jgi:hypothetical protein
LVTPKAFPQAQALSSRSRQGTTAFAGILPFFSNAFRAQRVNLKVNIARPEADYRV